MSDSSTACTTLQEWIARESIGFTSDAGKSFDAAVDALVARLGDGIQLLGLGEALHGDETILKLRNRLFQRLVERHGYTAIALESSFPRGQLVSEYISGRGPASYEQLQDLGFSHGFGRFASSRELVEWMRSYNAEARDSAKLEFYGFDSPSEMTGTDSPRQLLHVALEYLGSDERRVRIDELLGSDAAWENPAAMMDPGQSIGLSPAASALRIETEELITELRRRRPELVERTNEVRYLDAEQHARVARTFLSYHAGLARSSPNRIAELLGIRDLIMADNLVYTGVRERIRTRTNTVGGKVFAFAHNSHLKKGQAEWQLGPHALAWWPAGAHLVHMLGEQYATIGQAIGTGQAMGISQPEPATLEAHLISGAIAPYFIPTASARSLPASEIGSLSVRSQSYKNPGYFPFTSKSLTEHDGFVILS